MKNRKEKDKIKQVEPHTEAFINSLIGVFFIGFSIYTVYILFNAGNISTVGIVGNQIFSVVLWLIGGIQWVFPVVLLLYGIMLIFNKKFKANRLKMFAFIAFFILSASLFLLTKVDFKNITDSVEKEFLRVGLNGKSGGVIAAGIDYGLYRLFGKDGASIFIITLLVINTLVIAQNLVKAILRVLLRPFFEGFKKKPKENVNLKNEKVVENTEKPKDAEKSKNKDEDFVFFKLKKDKKESDKLSEDNGVEKNENNFVSDDNYAIIEEDDEEDFDDEVLEVETSKGEKQEIKIEKKVEEKNIEVSKTRNNNSTQKKTEEKDKLNLIGIQTQSEEMQSIFKMKEMNSLPKEELERRINEKILKLQDVLAQYGIEGRISNYQKGPVITRFELSVAAGTRVKRIVALADDIAMNLEAKSIRIEAPIPGKNAIGIEIPNDIAEPVFFSNILENKNIKASKGPVDIILGKDIVGEDIVVDLRKMPHLLIAGRTGSGKSVCINTLISSIIYKSTAEEVKFIMVDPKMVELMPYNGIPHLLVPVIIEPKLAAIALKWAVNEMENRYKLLSKVGVRNLEGYNKLSGVEKLPYIVVVIDELADLMMVAPGSIEESIARIAQKARAIGIHLVVATQRPSTDVITGTIKANLPSRISFSVASQIDSRTILDTPGAERLLGRGDMLFLESGSSHLVRIQGAYISDEEVIKFTDYLKSTSAPTYNPGILTDSEDEDKDELYEKALEVIKAEGKVSTSLIQRKLKIGYSRAARIMDQFEEGGIISVNEDGEKELLI